MIFIFHDFVLAIKLTELEGICDFFSFQKAGRKIIKPYLKISKLILFEYHLFSK